MSDKIRIWHFGDTHNNHRKLEVPEDIDIAIFSGDAGTYRDPYMNEPVVWDFIDWYSELTIPYKIFVAGNHDCYHKDTLFLTEKGWLKYDEIEEECKLATFDEQGNIKYEKPYNRIKGYSEYIYDVNSSQTRQIVTKNHNLFVDGELKKLSDINDNEENSNNFLLSGKYNCEELDISDNYLKVLNFILSDATIVWKESNKRGKYISRIQFKISKKRKIDELERLLTASNITYTIKPCKKYGINKLQPYYIRIYGDEARSLCLLLNNKKEIPEYFRYLSIRQKKLFIDYFENTDGYVDDNNAIDITTIDENFAYSLMELCTLCGYDSYYNRSMNGGFKNSKEQYNVRIVRNRLRGQGRKIQIEKIEYKDDVVCFSVPSKTLITMYDGKIAFSGNSSVEKGLIKPDDFLHAGIVYLEDQLDTVSIKGEVITIYGSPYTPTFNNWSYNKARHKLHKIWDQIPPNVDILVTHGPPQGILDLANGYDGYEHCGCANLYKQVTQRIKPKYHMFGHIHNHYNENYHNAGVLQIPNCDTIFSNGSVCTDGKMNEISSNGNVFEYKI